MDLIEEATLRSLIRAKGDASLTFDEFIDSVVAELTGVMSEHLRVSDPSPQGLFRCSCGSILCDPTTFMDGRSVCKPCMVKQPLVERVPASPPRAEERAGINVLLSHIVRKHFRKEVEAVRMRMDGNEAFSAGDCQKAIELYTQALQTVEDDPALLACRSQAFAKSGCFVEALRDANRAVYKNPRQAKVHYLKATALDGMANLYEACASYMACLVLEKDNATVERRLRKILKIVVPDELNGSVSIQAIDQVFNIATLCQRELATIESNIPSLDLSLPAQLLQDDFDCVMCRRLLFEPITTPCGHTFCRSCLNRSFDHRPTCPSCRSSLAEYLAKFVGKPQPVTIALESIIQWYFPDEYEARRRQNGDELTHMAGVFPQPRVSDEVEVPIFVCTAAFPTVKCPLYIFEPRYRLMIRRCIESGSRQFGMCEPVQGAPFAGVGTLLIIQHTEFLPDGRSLIDTIGGRRFRVVSRGMNDGYNSATVCFFSDDKVMGGQEREELQRLCTEVYAATHLWYRSLPMLLRDRVAGSSGDIPQYDTNADPQSEDDGPGWVWWAFGALQGQFDASQVLGSSRLGERLVILQRILNEQTSTVQLCRPQ